MTTTEFIQLYAVIGLIVMFIDCFYVWYNGVDIDSLRIFCSFLLWPFLIVGRTVILLEYIFSKMFDFEIKGRSKK